MFSNGLDRVEDEVGQELLNLTAVSLDPRQISRCVEIETHGGWYAGAHQREERSHELAQLGRLHLKTPFARVRKQLPRQYRRALRGAQGARQQCVDPQEHFLAPLTRGP